MTSTLQTEKQLKLPLVSVIIPVHNGARYISNTLTSIANQTYTNIDLIVVDDRSNDETVKIVRESGLEISLIQLPKNGGVAHARNVGIREARGDFIAFLDSDDLWDTSHLDRHLRLLLSNQAALASCGMTTSFRMTTQGTMEIVADSFTPFHVGASVFRTALFDQVGLFNEHLTLASDADFYFRCSHAKVHMIKTAATSLYYRKSERSLSSDPSNPRRMLSGIARVLKHKISREINR